MTTNPNAKMLGSELQKWRKEDGLTQRQLAERSGVPLTAVRRCEQQGQISMNRYTKLVATLKGLLKLTRPPKIGSIDWYANAVEQALIKKGVKPIRMDWGSICKQKEEQRMQDQEKIRTKQATPLEIQEKNSIIPRGARNDIRIVNWGESLT